MFVVSGMVSRGQSQAQWNNGAAIKCVLSVLFYPLTNSHCSSNLYVDVATRLDCQNYYGFDTWFGGHRNNASGIG